MSNLQEILNTIGKIFFLGFLSYFVSDGQPQTTKTSGASTVVEVPTRGLLFEIKSGKNTAYLFGSIHVARDDFYPMSPKVEAAYTQADTVAVEVDTSDAQKTQAIMPKLSYVAPDKLEKHLKAATWERFKATFGPGAEQFQTFKPFLVTSALTMQVSMQMGYNPAQGVDLHYIRRSQSDKKSLVELESLQFQADIMGGLSDEEGDALISSTLDSFKSGDILKEFTNIVTLWKAADANGIAKAMLETGHKDAASRKLTKLILDDRNEAMVAKMSKMMNEGKKLFVVIGAGHLAGEKSVIDLFQKQGLEVKQIR